MKKSLLCISLLLNFALADPTNLSSFKDITAGNAELQYNLGLMHYSNQDFETAKQWLTLAANQKHHKSQYSLAVMYENGYGVDIDYKKALQLYELAAKDIPHARHNIGVMYEEGKGVPVNYTEALKWYTDGKYNEDVLAETAYNLGVIYANGNGVRQDNSYAKDYFGQACDAGLQLGCDEYKKIQ